MKEKTIDTYSMLGKPIKNTKQQWVDRWKDCTVSSLAGLMPIGEYRDLVDRIITLAGEDFDRRAKWDLQKIIYYRGSRMIIGRCRPAIWRAAGNFLKPEERMLKCTCAKHQAASSKPQASSRKHRFKKTCTNPEHVLKIDLTERYNYEYKRCIKTSGRFK